MKVQNKKINAFTLPDLLIAFVLISLAATLIMPVSITGKRKREAREQYIEISKEIQKAITQSIQIEAVKQANMQLEEDGIKKRSRSKFINKFDDNNPDIPPFLFYADDNSLAEDRNVVELWKRLSENMQIQGFSCKDLDDKEIVKTTKLFTRATWQKGTSNATIGTQKTGCSGKNSYSPWMVSEYKIALSIESHIQDDEYKMQCGSVSDIESKTSIKEAIKASCAQIIVDLNGLGIPPNISNGDIETGENVNTGLQGTEVFKKYDRFRIYVGNDGITSGPSSLSNLGSIKLNCIEGFKQGTANGCILCPAGSKCYLERDPSDKFTKIYRVEECEEGISYSIPGAKACIPCNEKYSNSSDTKYYGYIDREGKYISNPNDSSGGKCKTCFKNKNECDECMDGYYKDSLHGTLCIQCPKHCMKCKSASECTECESGYKIKGGVCVLECPSNAECL